MVNCKRKKGEIQAKKKQKKKKKKKKIDKIQTHWCWYYVERSFGSKLKSILIF